MQNRIINLERLFKKYQFRFGENDAVVLEFKRELDTCQQNIDRLQQSAISNRRNSECPPAAQLEIA
jgi:hypothetical protein